MRFLTLTTLSLLLQTLTTTAIPTPDSISALHEPRDAQPESEPLGALQILEKRRGGGGGGGKGGGSSGGSSSGGGKGGGSSSSGSSSSGSSSSGSSGSSSGSSSSGVRGGGTTSSVFPYSLSRSRPSSSSSTRSRFSSSSSSSSSSSRPRTSSFSTPDPSNLASLLKTLLTQRRRASPHYNYGSGGAYAGGASTPYRAGGVLPSTGVSPLLVGGALGFGAGALLFGHHPFYYYGPFAYHYPYHNPNTNSNTSLPVSCVCAQYNPCGCDAVNQSSIIDQELQDGTANITTVNGTMMVVINGTLDNGTASAASSLTPAGGLGTAVWGVAGMVALMMGAL